MCVTAIDPSGAVLGSGEVLVAGGTEGGAPAEIYDPTTDSWSELGDPALGNGPSSATALKDGRVLLLGLGAARLYDPRTRSFEEAASPAPLRAFHTATLLLDGKVLLAGGGSAEPGGSIEPVARTYDPASNAWSDAGAMAAPRAFHTATLVSGGKVLVAGGQVFGNVGADAELYDPASRTWSATRPMHVARLMHTATLLADGNVLVAGGALKELIGPQLQFAEVYNPKTAMWASVQSMKTPRDKHIATLIERQPCGAHCGEVLVAGGSDCGFCTVPITSSELFSFGSFAAERSSGSHVPVIVIVVVPVLVLLVVLFAGLGLARRRGRTGW